MTQTPISLKVAPPAPDEDIIELLEHWLEEARAGRIKYIVVVGTGAGSETGWQFNASIFDDQLRLLGALEYARFKVIHRQHECDCV